MSAPLVGVDVGTSGTKGVAIDDEGSVLASAEATYPLSTPRNGWAEQDPEDWRQATESVLAELRAAVGAPAAVGLSGQMHGLVALDAHDRVLRPAILWNDQRTAQECHAIERAVGLERLIALTGNRALPGFTAPKLLWLRRHEPDVYAQIARIALPKDYVRLRLCGEHATDVSDASGTLLLDVAERRWSEAVLEALEVPHQWLPPALESPSVTGMTEDGVPIAAGGGDQAAGA
ncbi:MAG: FGGY family carbohydrate kinase, partial [Solirubrobacteraceae bacterium]